MTGTVLRFPAAQTATPDPLFQPPRSRVLIDALVLAAAIRAGAAATPTTPYTSAVFAAALALNEADALLPPDDVAERVP